jgi:DNA-binding LacI/PurR family transcriptional regulator
VDTFPELNREWFKKNGFTDPDRTVDLWTEWLSKERKDKAKYKKVLELATGLHSSAIGHYLSGVRAYKLSERTLLKLDSISRSLGMEPTGRKTKRTQHGLSRAEKRVAILTELTVPSLYYHMEVIRGVLRGIARYNMIAELYEATRTDDTLDIHHITRSFRPDAYVLIRITPDARMMGILQATEKPVILIHADRLRYPCPPVLINIVPDQEQLIYFIHDWALRLQENIQSTISTPKVVVVAMPDEYVAYDYDPLQENSLPSIRNQRKQLVLNACEAYNPILETIPDYSFRHALEVFRRHRSANAFICLSDEVAVGLLHLCKVVSGTSFARVVGFDDSPLAKAENLTSFGQNLEDLGDTVARRLRMWFDQSSEGTIKWPQYEEIQTDLYLSVRD